MGQPDLGTFVRVRYREDPENFGSQAEWPMHPELLDWLAVEFAKPTVLPAGGRVKPWDMKGMIKFLMLSRAYRQSSRPPRTCTL